MKYYKKLVGKKCYLSPCTIEDAGQWIEWDNDLSVAIPLGEEAYVPYSLEKRREYIGNILKQTLHVFGIVDLNTNTLIGRNMLININYINRSAILSTMIGDKTFWNKGYGSESTRLILDYGFNLLNLNNIMLDVFAFNTQAVNCYNSVGFKEIGRRRKAKIIAGKMFDIIYMDILASEFESIYVKTVAYSSKAKNNKP